MVRSVLAALAFVILSGFVVPQPLAAQQEARTHEVREGDTLWRIAQQYYDNGREWNRIFEANRDRIGDPQRLEVGLVLTIPGVAAEPQPQPEPAAEELPEEPEVTEEMAEVGAVEVQTPETPPVERAEPVRATGPKPLRRRTAFFPDTTNPTLRAEMAPMLSAVSRDVVFSAPWVVAEGETIPRMGQLVGFAGSEGDVTVRVSARPQDRVRVHFDGPVPAVGAYVQVYRRDHDVPDLGTIVQPTGVVRITSLEPAGAVAQVVKLYAQMAIGDLVGSLPAYALSEGQRAGAAEGTVEADIIGFANPRPIYSIGDMVFLGAGSADGVNIGDEYVVTYSSGEGWTGDIEGRLQVVGVHEHHSTARIVAEESPIFALGVRVRLDRQMR